MGGAPGAIVTRLVRDRADRALAFSMTSTLRLACIAGLSGCASVQPFLAPARTLGHGRVSVDLGAGYAAPLADAVLSAAARVATERSGAMPADTSERDAIVRAAAGYSATPPGAAPYASLRVGIGPRAELGLAWIGRALRIGARAVVWTDEVWAFSLGIATRGVLVPWPGDEYHPSVQVSDSRHVGFDATAVLGRTSSRIYDIYLGARLGYAHSAATIRFAGISSGAPFDAFGHRIDVAALLGLRVGFGRFSAALELQFVTSPIFGGASIGATVDAIAFSLQPAGALQLGF